MNIAVAGTGYVGLSMATLLAQHNHVTAVAVEMSPEKAEELLDRSTDGERIYSDNIQAFGDNLLHLAAQHGIDISMSRLEQLNGWRPEHLS